MAKVSFDGQSRIITVLPGVSVINVQIDLYSDWKEWYLLDENSKYAPAFRTFGGDSTIAGQYAPRYFFLTEGWRILVDGLNLVVGSNLYTDEGEPAFILQNNASVSLNNSDVPVVEEATRESLAYDGQIVYDMASPYSGVGYPIGTRAQPVNNLSDALAIGQIRSIHKIFLQSNLILNQDVIGYNITSAVGVYALVGNGFKFDLGSAERITITGNFNDSEFVAKECLISNVSGVSGIFENCPIIGVVRVRANDRLTISHSYSILDIGLPCIFDMNDGNTSTLNVNEWSGDATIMNCNTNGSYAMINFTTGNLTIDSSCIAGDILLRGTMNVNDNSLGSTINTEGLLNTKSIVQILGLSQSNFKITNTVYDTDGNLLSSNVKIYPTPADANSGINHITEYQMNATWNNGLMTDYKMVEV